MKFATALSLCALISGTSLAVPPPAPHGPVPTERQHKLQELEMHAICHFTTITFTGKENDVIALKVLNKALDSMYAKNLADGATTSTDVIHGALIPYGRVWPIGTNIEDIVTINRQVFGKEAHIVLLPLAEK